MTKLTSSQLWISKGYLLFAENGLQAIQVEPLSAVLGRNKSGFYHYFGNRDAFLEALMEYHFDKGRALALEYSLMKQLFPNMGETLVRYPDLLRVQMQLLRFKENSLLFDYYNRVNALVDDALLPLWAEFLDLSNNISLARQYYQMIRDALYFRIVCSPRGAEYVNGMIEDAKSFIDYLRQKENTDPISV